MDANAYLIFDYQSETDFKFAGINAKTKKLEIGHRTDNGWVVDVQTPAKFRDGVNYQLLVSVNDTTVTVVVDNKYVANHSFDARIEDGFRYGLNAGLLGVGAHNSVGFFDNVMVQILPPEFTFAATHDFGGSSAAFNLIDITDSWRIEDGRYVGISADVSHPAQSLIDLAGLVGQEAGSFRHEVSSVIELSAMFSTTGVGGFTFDSYGPSDYKFVILKADSGELAIGHYTERTGWVEDAVISIPIPLGVDVDLEITLKGSTVSVEFNNAKILEFAYNAVVVDGSFGTFALAGETSFGEIAVRSSDPAFDFEAMRAAAQAEAGTEASPIAVEDAERLFDEAVRRLTTHSGSSPSFGNVELRVVDLPDQVLAQTNDNVILIDADAAGHGWFLDPTPSNDEEFASNSDNLLEAVTGLGAEGRIDLLTVLTHELGHIAGFDHGANGVEDLMSVSLTTGLRLISAPGSDTSIADPSLDLDGASLVFNEQVGDFVTREEDAVMAQVMPDPIAAESSTARLDADDKKAMEDVGESPKPNLKIDWDRGYDTFILSDAVGS